MKLSSVIKKSAKEQTRQFWLLILTISMAPFFVFVYYLISEASRPSYDLLILNQDNGYWHQSEKLDYSQRLLQGIKAFIEKTPDLPLNIKMVDNKAEAVKKVKNKKADALIVVPADFSRRVHDIINGKDDKSIRVEFIGDLTNVDYMIGAIWGNEMVNEYVFAATKKARPLQVIETGLGVSGKISDFDLWMPGLLILSVIFIMFSATIAVVTEVEHKTIIRLKLSKLSALEYLSGVSLVQVLIGIISVLLTLLTAVSLGFEFKGSFALLILLVVLTGISMIAFSLIVAAFTKTANEVLIVANFPLFLFMFFTGAAFPMKANAWFTIFGYPVTLQGLMSPTHAVSALNKVAIMNMGLTDILPELIAIIVITIIYFIIGVWTFQRRHMKVE